MKHVSGGECPASHPYVYFNGEYCCQTNREKVYRPRRGKCDGGVIERDSLCCEADRYVGCPSKPCQNYNQQASGQFLHKIFSIHYFFAEGKIVKGWLRMEGVGGRHRQISTTFQFHISQTRYKSHVPW